MDRVRPQYGLHTHTATVQFSLQRTVAVTGFKSVLLAVTQAMKLIKFSIIVFVLMVGPCIGKLEIANSYRGKSMSRLVIELGNILKCCYGDQIPGVGLVGNLPSTLSRTLIVQHLIPAVLIDNNMILNNMPRHLTNDFRYKLHVFIIEGYSTEQLGDLIGKTMKSSVWWNHMASFFILDLSRGCRNAKDFLLLAWKHDMLMAKVMCRPRRSERSIFNYNPFTSQAPVSWKRTEVFPAINNHPFTLLNRKYQENETICADLDFDKTKELGRYRIILEGRKWNRMKVSPWEIRNKYDEFLTIRHNILRNVYRALNLKATYNGKDREWEPITETDMIAYTVGMQNNMHKKMSYQIEPAGRQIITRFRNGEPRRFNEGFTVRGIDRRIGTPIVHLITLLVFKFFVDQALAPALLNLIRVPYNTSFINLRDTNAMRVHLTNVGFFLIMMQAIFYANLTYPLIKQIPPRNVETMEDLVDLGYKKVIGNYVDKYFYKSVGPKKVFEVGSFDKCIKLLKKNSSIACMDDLYYHLDTVEKLNLHLNRQFHNSYYDSFPIRSNWPLEERVNTMFARSVEANVLEPWYLKFNLVRTRIFRKGEMNRSNKNVECIIKLGEMTFVFIFLGIGHMCATVVFIIELVRPYRCRCRIRRVRRYWRLERNKKCCVSLTSKFDLTV